MMNCSRMAVVLLMLAGCLSPVSGQSVISATSPRKCERVEMADQTRLKYDMNPGETVLIMWYNGSEILMPLYGLVFPEYTRERSLRLFVQIRQIEKDGLRRWRLTSGTCDPDSWVGAGRFEDAEEGELPLPVRSIPFPSLNGDEGANVEMFMVPYRVVGERVEGLVYAIASDIEPLKTALQGALAENRNFSWEESFSVASTPATGLDKSQWLPVRSTSREKVRAESPTPLEVPSPKSHQGHLENAD